MTTANELNKQTIDTINLRGGFAWRNNVGRRGGVSFGKRGSGDVIGMYRGYFISVETKTPNDRASEYQLDFVIQVQAAGGFACFVHDIDEVIAFLDAIDEHERQRGRHDAGRVR